MHRSLWLNRQHVVDGAQRPLRFETGCPVDRVLPLLFFFLFFFVPSLTSVRSRVCVGVIIASSLLTCFSRFSMASKPSFIIFEDLVEVQSVDDKQFTKVGRCHCKSENFDLEIKMDLNTQIYKVEAEDKLNLALASSLSLDDTPDQGIYEQNKSQLPAL